MTDCENASLGGNQSPGERWKRVWKSKSKPGELEVENLAE
jgi:hypothetical protein